jgi:hypothetical protein
MRNPKFRNPTGLTKQVLPSPEPGIDIRVGKMVFGTEKMLKFAPMIAHPVKGMLTCCRFLFLLQGFFLVPASVSTTMFFSPFYRR